MATIPAPRHAEDGPRFARLHREKVVGVQRKAEQVRPQRSAAPPRDRAERARRTVGVSMFLSRSAALIPRFFKEKTASKF